MLQLLNRFFHSQLKLWYFPFYQHTNPNSRNTPPPQTIAPLRSRCPATDHFFCATPIGRFFLPSSSPP